MEQRAPSMFSQPAHVPGDAEHAYRCGDFRRLRRLYHLLLSDSAAAPRSDALNCIRRRLWLPAQAAVGVGLYIVGVAVIARLL